MREVNILYNKPKCDDPHIISLIKKADNQKQILADNRPFDEELLSKVKEFHRTSYIQSSESVEGNTLTLGETELLIREGITVQGKKLDEILSTCGHNEAYDYIFSLIDNKIQLNSDVIKRIHKYLFNKISAEKAGRYKDSANFIGGSEYYTVPAEQVELEMEKLDKWIKEYQEITHPIIFAAELHRKLVYIHPFSDGNGRTARLVMNLVLISNGYMPCLITPYTKIDYFNGLESGRNGEMNSFYDYIAELELSAMKDFIRYMEIKPKSSDNIAPIPKRR